MQSFGDKAKHLCAVLQRVRFSLINVLYHLEVRLCLSTEALTKLFAYHFSQSRIGELRLFAAYF